MKNYKFLILLSLMGSFAHADFRFCNKSNEKIDVEVDIPADNILTRVALFGYGCTGVKEKFTLEPGQHHDIKTKCSDLTGGVKHSWESADKNRIKINGESACYIHYRSNIQHMMEGSVFESNQTVLLYKYTGNHRKICKDKWSWHNVPGKRNCEHTDLEYADKWMKSVTPRKIWPPRGVDAGSI